MGVIVLKPASGTLFCSFGIWYFMRYLTLSRQLCSLLANLAFGS